MSFSRCVAASGWHGCCRRNEPRCKVPRQSHDDSPPSLQFLETNKSPSLIDTTFNDWSLCFLKPLISLSSVVSAADPAFEIIWESLHCPKVYVTCPAWQPGLTIPARRKSSRPQKPWVHEEASIDWIYFQHVNSNKLRGRANWVRTTWLVLVLVLVLCDDNKSIKTVRKLK